jgi:hypothetical protein
MPLKVAIVGGAPSSQMLAPFDDPEWEVWVLGNQLSAYEGKSINRIFEIHDDLTDKPPEYPEWLVKYAYKNLVVSDTFPIKGQEIYPEKEASEFLGGFLSSSPAYMMAYALLKGATDIGLYGIDMSVDDHEYFKQRPDMYAWIAYAKAKGVNVVIPKETPLFVSTYSEGRDWGTNSNRGLKPFTQKGFKALCDTHGEKVKSLELKIAELTHQANIHRGSMQAYTQMGRVARALESNAVVENLTDVTWIQ